MFTILSLCAAENRRLSESDNKIKQAEIKLTSVKNAITHVGIQNKAFRTSSKNVLLGTRVCEYFASVDPRKRRKKKVSSRSSIASGYIFPTDTLLCVLQEGKEAKEASAWRKHNGVVTEVVEGLVGLRYRIEYDDESTELLTGLELRNLLIMNRDELKELVE